MKHNLALLLSIILITACSDTDIEKTIPLPLVKVAPLNTLLIQNEHSVAADTISVNHSNISAEISAVVAHIDAKVGDIVEPGQTLISLDCRHIKLRSEQAKAQLESLSARESLAEIQFNRSKRLRKQKSISEAELNSHQAELVAARANRQAQYAGTQMAANDVEKCIIKAPYKAAIMNRYAQVGELANPGSALMYIMQIEPLEVSAHLVASEANSLENADSAAFIYKGIEYPLHLRAITAAIDQRRRTQEARLTFVDKTPKPGTSGRLVWHDQLPALPSDFVSRRKGQLGVLYIRGNRTEQERRLSKVEFHPLAEAKEGQPVSIALDADTQIITSGRFSLSVDDEVEIVD